MLPLITLKQFWNDLRRQKLRSALTMFGIFWGTCSIVLLFAFGKGIGDAQLKSQKGMGDNIAIFWPGITAKEFRGLPKGRHIQPTEDDVTLIREKSVTIGRISPEFRRWNQTIKRGRNSSLRMLVGCWPEFGDMRNLIPQAGSRFINEMDLKERRRVVFIGNLLKEDLFGQNEAVGEQIEINGMPFTVIGVMKDKKQNSSYGSRDSRVAFIPASTFGTMYSARWMSNFVVQAKKEYSMAQARQEIYDILGARYKFDPEDREALAVWDTTRGFEFLKTFFTAFQWFLVGIGISTLITGGIGVSNIMNVVLEERTKEIGIKMALGARKGYILLQFVLETLLITAVGGVLGFLFAWLLVSLVPSFGLTDFIGVPQVNLNIGVLVILLLGVVGFFAGIFPARRAANLQPVQALKLF
ncbi:MAG: ABC transporter permease [candidate division Zixibacteria bacterium]|jgi:putative ABC transport system permease protein|nr:ABC transporter permease [candidate division Zixibacteria bacterium]